MVWNVVDRGCFWGAGIGFVGVFSGVFAAGRRVGCRGAKERHASSTRRAKEFAAGMALAGVAAFCMVGCIWFFSPVGVSGRIFALRSGKNGIPNPLGAL